jgi:formylglycine-generating enzyme required for sulfatase activity
VKKLVHAIVFFFLAFPGSTFISPSSLSADTKSTSHAYRGDLNEDGKIDTDDLIELLKMLNTEPRSSRLRELADVDESGGTTIDINDLLSLLRVVSGTESPREFQPGPASGPHTLEIPMVYIEGGSFTMGYPITPIVELNKLGNGEAYSNDNALPGWSRRAENPPHEVEVSDFEMSVYEITYSQFADFLNAAYREGKLTVTKLAAVGANDFFTDQPFITLTGGHSQTENTCWISFNGDSFEVVSGRENWPAVFITWYGAKAFALWYGYDLPTEAEWEYAGNAGNQYIFGTDDGTLDCSKANYFDCPDLQHPVDIGSYAPNAFGLYDMCGNAWEWCTDWFSNTYYGNSPRKDPPGPDTGWAKVGRGGCWFTEVIASRNVHRYWIPPHHSDNGSGIRLVRRPTNAIYP